MKHYDAIVIGTGQSGPFLAIRMAKEGRKVAIIERHLFGGTCVNTGCIPTKTLVASAEVAHSVRRAAEFGINVGEVTVDMKKVKARKDEIQHPSQEGAESRLREQPNIDVYKGQARFESAHVLAVGNERLTSEQIFINVGGRALIPPIDGIDKIDYLDNSSMMDVDFLPEHLIVIGGSYIGLEFGQMYRRFGSKVTILQRESRLIPREDEDVCNAIREIMEHEGITVRLNATCIKLEKRGANIVAAVDCAHNSEPVIGSHLLVAAGRRPNTDDLGLDKAGVQQDQHGNIIVDDQLRTNVPGIWALGDCNGRGGFTHTSYNDYEIVAANLLDNDPRRVSDRITGLQPIYRSAVGPRGHDRERGTQVRPQGVDRQVPDVERGPRHREERDAGIHEGAGGRGDETDSWRRHSGYGRRRGHSFPARRDVCQGAVHGGLARHAHPSHSVRVDTDDVAGLEAAGIVRVLHHKGRMDLE